jgi:hypothetical protein
MTKIVNVEAYRASEERYVPVEVYVDMEAHGVNSWTLKRIDGVNVTIKVIDVGQGTVFDEYGIDPITYDQVDAAARLQLLGER